MEFVLGVQDQLGRTWEDTAGDCDADDCDVVGTVGATDCGVLEKGLR